MKDILAGYRSFLVALERRSLLTSETYLGEIRIFLLWLREKDTDPERILKDIDTVLLTEYLEERRKTIGFGKTAASKSTFFGPGGQTFIEEGNLEKLCAVGVNCRYFFQASHPAAQFCHRVAGRRRGSQAGAGIAGACGFGYNPDLYPC